MQDQATHRDEPAMAVVGDGEVPLRLEVVAVEPPAPMSGVEGAAPVKPKPKRKKSCWSVDVLDQVSNVLCSVMFRDEKNASGIPEEFIFWVLDFLSLNQAISSLEMTKKAFRKAICRIVNTQAENAGLSISASKFKCFFKDN